MTKQQNYFHVLLKLGIMHSKDALETSSVCFIKTKKLSHILYMLL